MWLMRSVIGIRCRLIATRAKPIQADRNHQLHTIQGRWKQQRIGKQFSREICIKRFSHVEIPNRLREGPKQASYRLRSAGELNKWVRGAIASLRTRIGPLLVISCGLGAFALFCTTTLVSSIVIMFYGFELPEHLCQVLADSVSEDLGVVVKFEKLVIPGWTSGKIRLLEVKIESDAENWHRLLSRWNIKMGLPPPPDLTPETRNWSYWDLHIGTLDLELSGFQWLLGHGILKELSLNRVRGSVDRSHVFWPPDWKPTRRKPLPGDLEIGKMKLRDAFLIIKNPGSRNTFLSIFSAELPQLRKQWLLYDIIRAYSIVGMYDNCLFSLHRAQEARGLHRTDEHSGYSQEAIFTLKGLPIDHINRGISGPLSWITSATLDLDLNIIFPRLTGGVQHPWYDRTLSALITPHFPVFAQFLDNTTPSKSEDSGSPFKDEKSWFEINKNPMKDFVPMNGLPFLDAELSSKKEARANQPPYTGQDVWAKWKIRMNQPRAHVPPTNPDMNYLESALANSLCAFMNSLQTGISMSFTTSTPVSDFDGAWNIYSCGLTDTLFAKIWSIITNAYEDDALRSKQLRRIGIYGLQSLAKKVGSLLDYTTDQEPSISASGLDWILLNVGPG